MVVLTGESPVEKVEEKAELREVNGACGGSPEGAVGAEAEVEDETEEEYDARIKRELKAFRLNAYKPEAYYEDGILKYNSSKWSSEQKDYNGFGIIAKCGNAVAAEFCEDLRAQAQYTKNLDQNEKKMKVTNLPRPRPEPQPSFSRRDLYSLVYDYLDKNGLEAPDLEFLPERTMKYPFMVNSKGQILDRMASHFRKIKEKKALASGKSGKQNKKVKNTRIPVIETLIQSIELAIENGNTSFVRWPRDQEETKEVVEEVEENKLAEKINNNNNKTDNEDSYEDIQFPKFQDRTFRFSEEWCYYYY